MWQNFKRNCIKRPLRKLARQLLGFISRLTIKKHHPLVIVLIGTGPTSVVREALYSVIKETRPTRRNIELPEAEFSIPLTVLGYRNYPDSYRAWFWYLLKAYIQLFTVKPFNHALVLELNPVQQSVMDYWLGILKPKVVLQIGHSGFNLSSYRFDFYRQYKLSADSVEAYQHIATEVGQYLNIDELDIELGLSSMKFPEARLRFLPGKNGSFVIDATHYYFPIKLNSILESVDQNQSNLIAFTPFELDKKVLSQASWIVNPVNYSPNSKDLILLRGRRSELINKYGHLISTLKGNF